MSSKPNPVGETQRIAVEEASATINGVPMVKFDAFSIEVDDPSERERTTDGHSVHFDQLIEPEGSCGVYPVSPSAPAFFALVKSRTIGGAVLNYPSDDTRGSDSLKGVRYTNVSQEDLDSGGYMITADWRADYLL